jgi:hypothetical protein
MATKKYRIVLDDNWSSLLSDSPPDIEAQSPLAAAKKYVGGPVSRSYGLHGQIVVESQSWPRKLYLYNRSPATEGE